MRRRLPLAALLTATTISTCGSAMTLLAVPWFVLASTGSALDTGIVATAETAGLLASSMFGSPIVGRWGARRCSVASDLIAAVAVALVPILHAVATVPLWLLALLTALMGLTRGPGGTARYVLLPDLAEHAGTTLDRATSWYDGVSRTAQLVGGPVAGVLIVVLGPPQVLLVDAATFLASAVLIGPTATPARPPRRSTAGYLRELRTGASVLRRDRLLAGIVLMVMATNALDGGANAVIFPVYARDVLHSSVALGVLTASAGLGAVCGTVLYGWRGGRWSRWAVYTLCFAVSGAPRFLLFLTQPGLPVLAVGLALLDLGSGALNPILVATVFRRSPEHARAMVVGVCQAGTLAMIPLGTLLAGAAAQGIGLFPTLGVTAGLYLLATSCPLVFRSWRRLDEPVKPQMDLKSVQTAG